MHVGSSPSGLRGARRASAGGRMVLKPSLDHRIRIHAGPRVVCVCRAHRLVYVRGHIDVLPSGGGDIWDEEGASASLMLELSPSVMRRAAEESGRDPDRVRLEPRHRFKDPQIEHIAWALEADREAGSPSGALY